MTPRFNTDLLLDMLTYARPEGSITEKVFCQTFIAPLLGAYQDIAGNWHVKIGETPTTLWSCHTDTVHRLAGRQTLHYDANTGIVQLSKRSKAAHTCLGADDTAGIAILVQMVQAGIPGHYVFHYGEERGAKGSSWIAKHHAEWLGSFHCAIALDRKGTSDIITHQTGRCCSDDFARALANQLNAFGLHYAPSDQGLFTDTANYTDALGECTNLSIGYADAHKDSESLSVRHCASLFTALCRVDPSLLPSVRKPGEVDPLDWTWVGHDTTWPPITYTGLFPSNMRECVGCGIDYDYCESDALDFDEFCCAECERGYYAIFLDKSQARAQASILAQVSRQKGKVM